MLTQGDPAPHSATEQVTGKAALQGPGTAVPGIVVALAARRPAVGLASGTRLRRRGGRGEGAEIVESLGEVGVQVL
jgi:hypothetical protein